MQVLLGVLETRGGRSPAPSLTSGEAQSPDQGCGLSQLATGQAAKASAEAPPGVRPLGVRGAGAAGEKQGKPATAYLESVGRGVDTAGVPPRAPCWAVEADAVQRGTLSCPLLTWGRQGLLGAPCWPPGACPPGPAHPGPANGLPLPTRD